MIGALHSDGSVAAESYETGSIRLYLKTLEDAIGEYTEIRANALQLFQIDQLGLRSSMI